MTKMILTVPEGIDTEKFLNVATAIVRMRDGKDCNYGIYAESTLGELADGNSVDANLIDFSMLDAIAELQEICPVEIHFETDGGKSPYDGDAYDEELFNDALNELYRYNVVHNDLDIFTEIVNAHHERAYA